MDKTTFCNGMVNIYEGSRVIILKLLDGPTEIPYSICKIYNVHNRFYLVFTDTDNKLHICTPNDRVFATNNNNDAECMIFIDVNAEEGEQGVFNIDAYDAPELNGCAVDIIDIKGDDFDFYDGNYENDMFYTDVLDPDYGTDTLTIFQLNETTVDIIYDFYLSLTDNELEPFFADRQMLGHHLYFSSDEYVPFVLTYNKDNISFDYAGVLYPPMYSSYIPERGGICTGLLDDVVYAIENKFNNEGGYISFDGLIQDYNG